MTYPIVILVVAAIAVTVIAAFALPRFKEFFESLDAKLPLTTRILLSITNFLTDYGVYLLVGIFVVRRAVLAVAPDGPAGARRDRFVLRRR